MKRNEIKGVLLPKGIKQKTINFITSIIDSFDQEGKLNSLDHLSMYLLASQLDQYFICEEKLKKEGIVFVSDRGNSSLSPYALQQKTVMKDILALLKELGCTLSSRSKLKILENSDADSPLMKFLNSK